MKINTFSSYDLALSATISIWFPLETIDRIHNSQKVIFVFKRTTELDDLIERYWRKEILVEPRQYFDALKAMKSRLYGNI